MLNHFSIVQNDTLGRTLKATKPFKVGDIVMEETPLLVYESENFLQFFKNYSLLNEVEKMKILDFQTYASPDEAHFSEFRQLLEASKLLLSQPEYMKMLSICNLSQATAFRLIAISHINSHGFIGVSLPFKEIVRKAVESSALFEIASKVSHSCRPNCNYTSKNKKGKLIYYAIRPIAVDDVISFSYLDLSCAPTHQRRKNLRKTKDFFCCCDKCSGPDKLNGFHCGSNITSSRGCKGMKLCEQSSQTASIIWKCNRCGDLTPPDISIAHKVGARFEKLKYLAENGHLSPQLCEQLSALIEESISILSPTHHLVLDMLQVLSRFHASGAAIVEEAMPAMAQHFRELSALTMFRVIRRLGGHK